MICHIQWVTFSENGIDSGIVEASGENLVTNTVASTMEKKKRKNEKWISVDIVWRRTEGHVGMLNRINISRNRNGKFGRN